MATRSRKGYPASPKKGYAGTGWRMSGNSIVQRALTNTWLHECAFAGSFGAHGKVSPTVSRRSPQGED